MHGRRRLLIFRPDPDPTSLYKEQLSMADSCYLLHSLSNRAYSILYPENDFLLTILLNIVIRIETSAMQLHRGQ